MRICILTPFYPPFVGGIALYSQNLASALTKLGQEVVVYTNRIIKGDNYNDLSVFDVKRYRAIRALSAAWISPSLMRQLLNKRFDVINVQLLFPWGVECSLLAKALHGTPVVATVHNYHTNLVKATIFYERIFMNQYFQKFDATISTSKVFQRALQKHQKIDVVRIPVGIDSVFFTSKEFQSPSEHPYFLYVGGLGTTYWFKGVDILIRAFESLKEIYPNHRLLLIGQGDLNSTYKSLARELGVADRVYFLGAKQNRNLISYYQNADALILPSIGQETTGMPLLEAMACGTPVVTSDLPGPVEVTGGFATIFTRGDSGALARAICKAVEDHPQKELMRQFVRDNYSWERVGERVLETLRRVAQ